MAERQSRGSAAQSDTEQSGNAAARAAEKRAGDRQQGDRQRPSDEQVSDRVADKEADREASAAQARGEQADLDRRLAEQRVAGDAQLSAAATSTQASVTGNSGARFATKTGDVPVDPRTGQPFERQNLDGLKGISGTDLSGADVARVLPAPPLVVNDERDAVPRVDPDRIPAEVTPGVSPDAGGDKLFAAALAKAPSLTREFVDKMGLTDGDLAAIARGEVPPPPTPGPIYTADMHLTPGGWQQTPPGVPPEDVGANQISRA